MNCGTTNNSPGVKKLMQVSEEIQTPVHVPVVLGNECFIVTQQDVRKIEDIRLVSYHKLGPNGELIPIEMAYGQECMLRDAIMNAVKFQAQGQGQGSNQRLLQLLEKCCGQQAQTKATIKQQIDWANTPNSTSPAHPFTYSQSTTMNEKPSIQNGQCCCHNSMCCQCSKKYFAHKCSNTIEDDPSTEHIDGEPSAKQQLKLRKINEDIIGV